MMRLEVARRMFVILKGERERYIESIDPYVLFNTKSTEKEVARRCRAEYNVLQAMVDEETDLAARFFAYSQRFFDVRFEGNLTIRPYNGLFEAIKDGIMGNYDSGLLAATMNDVDGYLFVIRLAGAEDKAFGYVLYDAEGKILCARQACNLDIQNKSILNYLQLFSRDILLPAAARKEKIKIA